jgi:hypothetical protein
MESVYNEKGRMVSKEIAIKKGQMVMVKQYLETASKGLENTEYTIEGSTKIKIFGTKATINNFELLINNFTSTLDDWTETTFVIKNMEAEIVNKNEPKFLK